MARLYIVRRRLACDEYHGHRAECIDCAIEEIEAGPLAADDARFGVYPTLADAEAAFPEYRVIRRIEQEQP